MAVETLRVAHLITQLELGGAQRNTLYTVGHLDPKRYEPLLVCGAGGILDAEAKEGPWKTFFVKSLVRPVRPWHDIMAIVVIYRLLRKLKPPIVHTHSSKAGIVGRLAAYLAGVPIIIHTFHGFGFTPNQPRWMYRLFVKLERFCALLSTHLVFVSRDNMEEAEVLKIGTGKPRSLIRSGIAIQEPPVRTSIREDLGISKEAWVVASVGNFKPQKNPMDLARTAAVVLEKAPETHFILVGDGPLRSTVEQWAQSNGIADRLHFLGWRQDIPAILSASNAFLLTSLWEGLPRALVEAAVARRPAVAYAVNGVKDILNDEKTGFTVAPGEIHLAAEKLLWLKNHPAEARHMGDNARQLVEAEFNIDRMVSQQQELYESLYADFPLKKYYEPLWSR